MNNKPTPETDAEAITPSGFEADEVSAEFARRLERERDEARKKIEQQRLEIVRLNGATNHAGGTPLKIALRERDEAQKELEEYRSIAENIGAVKAVSEKEKAICERDEANEELHKQLVRYDQLFDEAEKIRIERDEARTELEEAQLCLKKAITELDLASVEIFKWERDFMIVVNDFKTVVKQLNK